METNEGKLVFLVKGSAPEPYKVSFVKLQDQLRAFCTCPAGDNGTYCKHRFNILSGDTSHIVSGNSVDVETIVSWIAGTDLEKALKEARSAEEEVRRAQVRLRLTHKRLSRSMHGH